MNLFWGLAIVVSLIVFPLTANAADLVWDITSGDGAAITDGDGTWQHDAGNVNWNDGVQSLQWNNANDDTAVFGTDGVVLGADYTVTVIDDANDVSAGGISFLYDNTSSKLDYLITGSTITLTGTDPTISIPLGSHTYNTYPVIDSAIAGTSDIYFQGYTTGSRYSLLNLGGSNTYSGKLELTDGQVSIATLNGISTSSTATVVNSNTQLSFEAVGTYPAGVPTTTITGFGRNTTVANASFGAIRFLSGGATEWQGDIVLAGESAICGSNGIGTISGVISGNYTLNKTGDADLYLTAENTYGGGTKIFSGELRLNCTTGGPAILGDVEFTSTSTSHGGLLYLHQDDQLEPDAVLNFTGVRAYVYLEGVSQTVGGLNDTHATSAKTTWVQNYLAATASTLTIDNDSDYTYVGGIREANGGTLAIVKTGTGKQSLLGGNSASYVNFSGGLTVEEGTLYADINARTNLESSIVVKSPGTLDVSDWTGFNIPTGKSLSGDGDVVGDVLVATGGTINAGTSVGELTVTGDLTVGGTWLIEYNGAAKTVDKLVISGGFDLGAATMSFVNLDPLETPMPNQEYEIAWCGGTYTAPADKAQWNLPPGWSVVPVVGNSTTLKLVVIPEPSTFVLLAFGLIGLAGCRIRP